jgi:beta-barrel assembly-enhancing protease
MRYDLPPPRRARHAQTRPSLGCGPRAIGAVILVIVSLVAYFGQRQTNPVTGEVQHVALRPDEEVVLGLQAAPEMAAQFGGVEQGTRQAAAVAQVGERLVAANIQESPYEFDFHLLRDPQTVNAFALPGGQIFITRALYDQLETEGQLAGVLGHEIAHVVHRHGAEQMARQGLTQGLVGAVATATSDGSGAGGSQIAAMVAGAINLRYGRNDELESDSFGLRYMAKAGYDPRALVGVMRILERASGGGDQPEWLSSHPKPGNRVQHIQDLIAKEFPNGVPRGLTP